MDVVVLAIPDDAFRQQVAERLHAAEFATVEATEREAAVALAERTRPRAIVVDVQLSTRADEGEALVVELKAAAERGRAPGTIVAVTPTATRSAADARLRNAGAYTLVAWGDADDTVAEVVGLAGRRPDHT